MLTANKKQTKQHKNSDKCIATEYPLGDEDINVAVVKISGRYPDNGRVLNTKCKELALVTEGSGKLFVEDKTIKLDKGDAVLIEPNEKYYWDGNMTMVISSTPAWYPKQHKNIK